MRKIKTKILLPPDILTFVIDYLQNDRESLFNCMLVSRTWSNIVVRVLYRSPFKLLYIHKEVCNCQNYGARIYQKRCLRAYNIFNTFMKCIIVEYYKELVENKVIGNSDGDSNNRNNNLERPIFSYQRFIRSLDFNYLFLTVDDIYRHVILLQKPSLKTKTKRVTKRRRHRFNHNVTYVDHNSPYYDNVGIINSVDKIDKIYYCKDLQSEKNPFYSLRYVNLDEYFMMPSYYPSGNNLKYLTEFICTTKFRKSNLFVSLSQVSTNIKTIIVNIDIGPDIHRFPLHALNHERNFMDKEVRCLASLIKSQKNLNNFELHKCNEGLIHVLSALKSQLNTLKSLKLVKVNLSSGDDKLLDYFNNNDYQFSKLESLYLDESTWNVKNDQVDLIVNIFKNCRKIESIHLYQESKKNLSIFDTNEILERSSKIGLPTSLKHFTLSGRGWFFTPLSLEYFLTPNNHNHHQPYLSPLSYTTPYPVFTLEILESDCFTFQHMEAIIKSCKKFHILNQFILKTHFDVGYELIKIAKKFINKKNFVKFFK
ncbi:9538_t:CDS:2 [Entrophospora sp. SA101]|nr:9538_t:CDS:2 [Entrophospora sp. SA101]